MADNQDGRWWGGLFPADFRLVVLLLASTAMTSCAGAPKKPATLLKKYFPDRDPETSLVGFVFAIESGNWDTAYSRLSRDSKEKISSLKFKVGLPIVKDPRTGIPVLEIITGSITNRTSLQRAPGQPKELERIQLDYYGKDSQGRLAAYLITVYLRDEREPGAEDPAWRIDLLKTAETIAGPQR